MDLTKQLVTAVLVVAVLVTVAWLSSETIKAQRDQAKLDAFQETVAAIVQRVDERIVDLPEDGGSWYTSLYLHEDWRDRPDERQLIAWFQANDRLVSLKAQTHWNVYTPGNPMHRTRWVKFAGEMPCVLVQESDGKVVYKASGDNLPGNPDQLADDIVSMWPCPRPEPEPKPEPEPDTKPKVPDTVPDIVPKDTTTGFPVLLLLGAIAAACGGVLYIHFKRPGGLA